MRKLELVLVCLCGITRGVQFQVGLSGESIPSSEVWITYIDGGNALREINGLQLVPTENGLQNRMLGFCTGDFAKVVVEDNKATLVKLQPQNIAQVDEVMEFMFQGLVPTTLLGSIAYVFRGAISAASHLLKTDQPFFAGNITSDINLGDDAHLYPGYLSFVQRLLSHSLHLMYPTLQKAEFRMSMMNVLKPVEKNKPVQLIFGYTVSKQVQRC